jgi:hypothetical protein
MQHDVDDDRISLETRCDLAAGRCADAEDAACVASRPSMSTPPDSLANVWPSSALDVKDSRPPSSVRVVMVSAPASPLLRDTRSSPAKTTGGPSRFGRALRTITTTTVAASSSRAWTSSISATRLRLWSGAMTVPATIPSATSESEPATSSSGRLAPD